RVSDVRYTTREASAARQRAIAAAVQRARTDAEAMARAAGGSLGPLLEITNVRNEVAGMYSGVAARGVREETSIAPRELFVRAVVVARWAFVQQ
ncbi:MAG TPA: SIMPL domain-containing protein, partial [Longimicrobiaceae bacterium]|nr:SIMPL domain-containing protein [Longimicrobiaceae bacterium]